MTEKKNASNTAKHSLTDASKYDNEALENLEKSLGAESGEEYEHFEQLISRLSEIKYGDDQICSMEYMKPLFNDLDAKNLPGTEINRILEIMVSYLGRRLFAGLPTPQIRTLFSNLVKKIRVYAKTQSDITYPGALLDVLKSEVKPSTHLPNNGEINSQLFEKNYCNLYKARPSSFFFILNEINRAMSKDRSYQPIIPPTKNRRSRYRHE